MIVNRFDYDKKRNTRSSRAGSRLFPLEKGAKELFARHFGSLLFISHVGTRSASLPKLARSRGLKHMERLVFCCCACYGYAQQQKIPSRATQSDSAGAALAFRQRSVAQKNAAYESALKPCFLFCVLFSNDRKWQAYSKPKKALKARKAI